MEQFDIVISGEDPPGLTAAIVSKVKQGIKAKQF